MQQFLIEAVLVCLIGGALGIILSLALGVLVSKATAGSFQMILFHGIDGGGIHVLDG